MGGPLLGDLERVSKRFREWTESARGQNAIRTYFTQARPSVRELGRTLAEAGKAFLRIGATPGLERTLATVRGRLIPALENMITTMARVAGPDIVNALASIAELFAALSPHIAGVAKFVAWAAGGLADLIRHEPAVGALAGGFLAMGAAVKAVKFIGMITGLRTVLGLVKMLRGGPGILGGAGAGAAAGGAGAAAGAGWAGGFKRALARAGLIGAAIALVATVGPPLLKKGQEAARAWKDGWERGGLKGALKAFAAQTLTTWGLVGDKTKQAAERAAEGVRRLSPAIRNAIRTNDVDALRRYGGELGKLGPTAAKSAARVRSALRNAAAGSDVTWRRLGDGLKAIPKTGEQAVGRLLRVFGRIPKVRKWALKTNEPEVAVTLARLSGRLRNLGRTRTVAKIIADSKNPQEAIRRLRGLLSGIHRRRTRALISAVDKASPVGRDVVKRLLRINVAKIRAMIKANPADARRKIDSVMAGLKEVARTSPNPKVRADARRAIARLQRTQDKLNRIDGFTATATVKINWLERQRRGWAQGGPVVPGLAQGGTPDNAPTRKSTGGRHSRPTFLVGEENRPEFVIATNPRYRKANLGYLAMAAGALGVPHAVPGLAQGGRAEDGSRIPNAAKYWGRGSGGGTAGKFLTFKMIGGFAEGGRFPGGFGHMFQFSERTPRSRRHGGMPRVHGPSGRWITPLQYSLLAAHEREQFYGLLGQMRGGRSSGEWRALSKDRREGITKHWEARRETIDKRHEHWQQRFEELRELFGQMREIRGQRRGERRVGRRVGRGQRQVIQGFARQWQRGQLVGGLPFAGSFAGGGIVSIPGGGSGLAKVHDRETILPPAPVGGYGSQLAGAPGGSDRPIRVEVVLKDRAGALVDVIDARINGQSAPVVSRQVGRRQRLQRSAPGQTRARFAR